MKQLEERERERSAHFKMGHSLSVCSLGHARTQQSVAFRTCRNHVCVGSRTRIALLLLILTHRYSSIVLCFPLPKKSERRSQGRAEAGFRPPCFLSLALPLQQPKTNHDLPPNKQKRRASGRYSRRAGSWSPPSTRARWGASLRRRGTRSTPPSSSARR